MAIFINYILYYCKKSWKTHVAMCVFWVVMVFTVGDSNIIKALPDIVRSTLKNVFTCYFLLYFVELMFTAPQPTFKERIKEAYKQTMLFEWYYIVGVFGGYMYFVELT